MAAVSNALPGSFALPTDYNYSLDDYLSLVNFPDASYSDMDFDALPSLGSPVSPISPASPVSPRASFDANPYIFSSGTDAFDLWSNIGASSDAGLDDGFNFIKSEPMALLPSRLVSTSPAIDPLQLSMPLSGAVASTKASSAAAESARGRKSGVRKSSGSSTGSASSTSSSGSGSGLKRKSLCASSPQAPKKTSHNLIEKRYRTNLNDKILALRDSVPSLRVAMRQDENSSDEDELDADSSNGGAEAGPAAHKLNKATILSKATEYIAQLEQSNLTLARENQALLSQVDGFTMRTMSQGGLNGVW